MNTLKFQEGIDQKSVIRFKMKLDIVLTKFTELLEDEMLEDEDNCEHVIHAAIYAPLSFVMQVFRKMESFGMQPNEEYPTFIKIYSNYLKALSGLEKDWKKLPFREFEKKFQKNYIKMGHFVEDTEEL